MRNEVLPRILVEWAADKKSLEIIGIGSAEVPEFLPSLKIVRNVYRDLPVRIMAIDPGYSFYKICERTMGNIKKELGVEDSSGIIYIGPDKFGNNLASYDDDLNSVRLCGSNFPDAGMPEDFDQAVVTMFNVGNYINLKDIKDLFTYKHVAMMALADTPNRGFIQRHPQRFDEFEDFLRIAENKGWKSYDPNALVLEEESGGVVLIR
jgi:hypothetical protein